jgi:hypothetical protein
LGAIFGPAENAAGLDAVGSGSSLSTGLRPTMATFRSFELAGASMGGGVSTETLLAGAGPGRAGAMKGRGGSFTVGPGTKESAGAAAAAAGGASRDATTAGLTRRAGGGGI